MYGAVWAVTQFHSLIISLFYSSILYNSPSSYRTLLAPYLTLLTLFARIPQDIRHSDSSRAAARAASGCFGSKGFVCLLVFKGGVKVYSFQLTTASRGSCPDWSIRLIENLLFVKCSNRDQMSSIEWYWNMKDRINKPRTRAGGQQSDGNSTLKQ